jgi:hypothetical protein
VTLLELYRTMIPAHAAVDEAVVLQWLALAERRHTASAWGAVYDEAMVSWAAHFIEITPGTGAGSSSSSPVGPLISQKDGDLSRTYAAPVSPVGGAYDGSMSRTIYGEAYLDLRNSRAAITPFTVTACR